MSNTDSLKVNLGSRSYDIITGNNLLENSGEYLAKVLPSKKVFIVTDDNVAPLYLNILEESLSKAGISYASHILPHGEQTKSFANLEKLMDIIFQQKPDRKYSLVALGGGVIGDLTGFAASIILRGINFVQIPTTLLAQVDSSVGGKTGINNKYGKNLVGSFYQPLLVLADTNTIKTLPKREFLAGYAEIVKYGIINNLNFFDYLDKNLDNILNQDNDTLQYIIKTSCTEKAEIVAQDEREGGVRALLNFGHTFGHALEKITGYSDKLLHGEAVAIGMLFAMKLSCKMELCSPEDVTKVEKHITNSGMKTSPLQIQPDWDINELISAMRQDKKAFDGKITFIVCRSIGDCFIQKDVPEAIVADVITDILSLKNSL